MTSAQEVLERSSRSVLAFSGRRWPLLAPMAFWSDGTSLWMSTPAVSVKALTLRNRPAVSVYVAPPAGVREGVLVEGTARVYGLHDPVGLALHAPVVSAAMAALAARNTGTILGYVQDARHVPVRFRPRNRVAVRVAVEHTSRAAPVDDGGGVAPALPTVVSAGVRRELSGRRDVVVGHTRPDGSVAVHPARWGAGFDLTLPPGVPAPTGVATVYVGTDPQRRPTQVAGLALTGAVESGRLRPERATWWEGFDLRSAEVPAATTIALPD